MYVILVYDINTETPAGAGRLNHIFKACKRYLFHTQKSVFEGELTEAALKRLREDIGRIIDQELDAVIIFKSSTEKWVDRETLGIASDPLNPIL